MFEFDPEFILPEQFRHRAGLTGEELLHVAILDQALAVLARMKLASVEFEETWVWFTSPDLRGPGFISLEMCCEVVCITPVALREALGQTREGAKALACSIGRKGRSASPRPPQHLVKRTKQEYRRCEDVPAPDVEGDDDEVAAVGMGGKSGGVRLAASGASGVR